MTATYMRILIHTMNNSLFPDANTSSTPWTGPPPEIITVQSLLYASLATSLLAAFLAMLAKQWVNRYLRNHGGSAADKSRDRQRKLDGLEKWHFHLAIESLPVMLQLALLLLGCALSRYLWTISYTIAGVTIAVTLFGVTSYIFLTLAATLYYNCPYQTPPSILTRMAIRHLIHYGTTFTALQSLIPPFSIKKLRQILGCLHSGAQSALASAHYIPTAVGGAECIPLAVVVAPPTQIFKSAPVDWDTCEADIRCISWVLYSTTDPDVILSTVQFAADMIWYPEIAGALSPHTLANLFFDCLLDGQVIPGKVEHASSIGMALASVLSIHLITEPESPAIKNLCEGILSIRVSSPEPVFKLVTGILRLVASTVEDSMFGNWELLESVPDHLSTTQKLWLSRVVLQTLWRWRCVQGPTRVFNLSIVEPICQRFATDGDQILLIFKTHCFLMLAISLGLQINICDLYPPNTRYVIHPSFSCNGHSLGGRDSLQAAINLFFQQLQIHIREGKSDQWDLMATISASTHLGPLQAMGDGELSISLIADLLNSGYPKDDCYQMACEVVQLLGKWFDSTPFSVARNHWIPVLSSFLLLCEQFYSAESPPHPGHIALRILSDGPRRDSFCETVLPVLISTLQPTHPLQSRSLALGIFEQFTDKWFNLQKGYTLSKDLNELLQAVGDPFQFQDPHLQDGNPVVMAEYKPMMTAVLLIEFASLDLGKNYLCNSNFTSCEEIMSTKEGKEAALRCMFNISTHSWSELLHTPAKMITAIRRLEELQCLNVAEVVILWAWTTGIVNPTDHDTWESIGHITLSFYQNHGIGRLTTLSQHIADTAMAAMHTEFLIKHYGNTSCQVQQLPILAAQSADYDDLCISKACQLRRLYHLFNCDAAKWGEMVMGEGVGGKGGVGISSGWPVMPDQFTGWVCDYP